MTTKLALLLGSVSLIAAAGMGYAAGHVNNGKMTSFDDLEWTEIAPESPVQVVVLWGDPKSGGEHGRLIKLPAGFVAPIHSHTGDYHAVNLTGTWRHSFEEGESQGQVLPTGSYVFQPGTGFHGDACVGSEDCILFIHQHQASDFIPRE
jgi:hypothetical protein